MGLKEQLDALSKKLTPNILHAQRGDTVYGNLKYDEADINKFYDNQITSDWYRQRLHRNGYTNPQGSIVDRNKDVNTIIRTRRNDVKNANIKNVYEDTILNEAKSKINNISYRIQEGIARKLPEMIQDKIGNSFGVPFTDYDIGSYYRDDTGKITYNVPQANALKAHPRTILTHEKGHAETRSGLSGYEEKFMEDRMGSGTAMRSGRMLDDHNLSPYETKSDMNALRYNLYKAGKFDPKTGKYKTKDGKFDPQLLYDVRHDFSAKRLREIYSAEDLKEIMDTIAQNQESSEKPMYAQSGGMVEKVASAMKKQGISVQYGFDGKPQYYKNGKILRGQDHGNAAMLASKTQQELSRGQVKDSMLGILNNPVVGVVDPTGVSNYPLAAKSLSKLVKPEEYKNIGYQDVVNVAGAVPLLGKVKTAGKILSTTKDLAKDILLNPKIKNKMSGVVSSGAIGGAAAGVVLAPFVDKYQDVKNLFMGEKEEPQTYQQGGTLKSQLNNLAQKFQSGGKIGLKDQLNTLSEKYTESFQKGGRVPSKYIPFIEPSIRKDNYFTSSEEEGILKDYLQSNYDEGVYKIHHEMDGYKLEYGIDPSNKEPFISAYKPSDSPKRSGVQDEFYTRFYLKDLKRPDNATNYYDRFDNTTTERFAESVDKDLKDFFNRLIKSDWHRERLEKNMGHHDISVDRYIGSEFDNLSRSYYGGNIYGEHSYSGARSNQQDTEEFLNPLDSDILGMTPEMIVAHEKSHSRLFNPRKGKDIGMPYGEYELVQNARKNDNVYTSSIDVSNMEHLNQSTEVKADIDGARYDMYKKGLFDPDTGRYKTRDGKFDKTLLKDKNLKRLLQKFHEDDVIEFFNKFSSDNTNLDIKYAQSGGLLRGSGARMNLKDQLNNLAQKFQSGGCIECEQQKMQNGGKTVAEKWEEATGTSWQEAKNRNLTDGSFKQNIDLMGKLERGELSNSNRVVSPQSSNTNFDNAATFNQAFSEARKTLGSNQIFTYKGKKFGTNIEGEAFTPSVQTLSQHNMVDADTNDRLNRQNKMVGSVYSTKKTVKVEPEYKDWDRIKMRKDELNKMKQADLIREFHKNSDEEYLVLDKAKGRMHLYKGDKEITSYSVGVGENKGDEQTRTWVDKSTKKTDWDKGNKQTGAGIYTVSGRTQKNKQFSDAPSWNFLNENGIEVPMAIHATESQDRLNKIKDNDPTNNRVSNGCINGQCNNLKDLYQRGYKEGQKLYVLPDNDENKYHYKNGKLILTSTDNKVNRTVNTLKYKPIKIYMPKDKNDVDNKFAQTLVQNKKGLMQNLKIDGDTYNDIVLLSLGILGQESNFGQSSKYKIKENNPGLVSSLKFLAGNNSNNSRGLTQIKFDSQNSEVQKMFKKYGVTKDNLQQPDKASLATVILLSHMYNNELKGTKLLKDSKVKWQDALLYLNQGKKSELVNRTATPDKNMYIKNIKNHMNKFKLKELD